jgi:hypothetical protein
MAGESCGIHGGGECDEDVYTFIESGMDAESCKSLRCALAKANIAQLWLFGDIQDMIDRIRDIVPCKVINAEQALSDADLLQQHRTHLKSQNLELFGP